MKGRSCFCVLLLFAAGALRAQEEPHHSPFGCNGHPVQLDVERNPQLKFIPLLGIPGEAISYNRQHTFLYAGPFTFVSFQLAATIGEQPVGRAIPATLGIYVETKQDGFPQSPAQFWQLVSTATQTRSPDRTSERLVFDSNRVAECLRNEDLQCEFAEPKLATPDPDIPLLNLSFMEDLGEANASNSQEAHILMDFRFSPPQVLVTADCAYNEGGGVCTAIDSGMAPRSDLQCDWVGDRNDFLCSEIREPEGSAHRDYYLLSQGETPLRNGEVATLKDAVKRLRTHPGTTAKLRACRGGGVGRRGEAGSPRESDYSWFAGARSSTRFYFIPESQNGLGVPVVVLPHDFGENDKPARGALDAHDWTVDQAVSFTSRPVYEDRSLSVLGVVAQSPWNHLYWIGVGKEHPSPDFDVIELAGGSQYASCGDYDVPPSVVDVKNIDHPFRAALQLQRPTVVSDADARPIAWSNGPDGEPSNDCQRTGELRWVGGRFQGAMQEALCKQPEKPDTSRSMIPERLGSATKLSHNQPFGRLQGIRPIRVDFLLRPTFFPFLTSPFRHILAPR